MKLGDDTHSGQQRVLKPQDIEAISSMMYNVSLQQGKTEKPFMPKVYQRRGRGQIEIDLELTVDKGQILVKIDAVIIIERMGTHKISGEIMAEVEVEILTEIIAVIGVDQEKEGYHPVGIITIIIIPGKTQILDSDQGLEVDPTQE